MNNERLSFAEVFNKIHSIAEGAIVYVNQDDWMIHVQLLDMYYLKDNYGHSDLMMKHMKEIREYFKIGSRCVVERYNDNRMEIHSSFFVNPDRSVVVR